MNRIIMTAALIAAIWFTGTSNIEANCPPQNVSHSGFLNPGDWVWVNPYGWCKVISVTRSELKPKAPKLDDGKTKQKTEEKSKEKSKEKPKLKAPKFDDK